MSFGGVAILFGIVALVSAPKRTAPDAFLDIGDPFFPEFTDPDVAATLDVVEFDEATASTIPFKVTNRGGLWTIPSHQDYPADGKAKLSTIAADIISVVKEDFRSDNVADHEPLGVIDPMDQTVTSLQGRGTRVTVRGASDEILADLIVGRPVEARQGLRFLRIPGQKRVYVARFEADISTAFEDWIEKNLLEVERDQVEHIVLNEYRINEGTRSVSRRRQSVFDKIEEDNWRGNNVPPDKEVNFVEMNRLVGAIIGMEIAGVRPKPLGMTGDLREAFESRQINASDLRDLRNKGFYPTAEGSLLSNEGELLVRTNAGVLYTLRFGEIVYGRGEAVVLGDETSEDAESGPGENRYVFITAEFDQVALPEPQVSDSDAHASWERRVREGKQTSERLAARFADWYYVISADSYDRIHQPREHFLKDRE